MKIVIIGSDKVYAIENYYVKYLRQAGVEVIHFPAQSMFYDYYTKNFLRKILFKLGWSPIYRQINDALKAKVESEKPSVVWIFKGMEIFPETLKWIKARGIFLVNYNPDNPFLFSGKGSGNTNVTDSIPLFDLHITYNLKIKTQLEIGWHARVAWIPFGFDVSTELFSKCEAVAEINSVCFVGNPDKERAKFVTSLAERGIKISTYGHEWNRFLSHPNIQICPPVYGEEQWITLRKYRVQLNLMRMHNQSSHNMRTFEVPGIGGIMVAPDTDEHRTFFVPDQEIFLFKTVEECSEKIKKLLQLPVSEANDIRARARARSMSSGYSYESRVAQVLSVLN